MKRIQTLETPIALIDAQRMQSNIDRMQQRMNALGVSLRPHVKTTKCVPVVQRQLAAGARGITVSTLKEAEQFFAAGIVDILYAVSMLPRSCRIHCVAAPGLRLESRHGQPGVRAGDRPIRQGAG